MKDLIIDCFAGGGGASVGIEMALGRPVDIAIDHDPRRYPDAQDKSPWNTASDRGYFQSRFAEIRRKSARSVDVGFPGLYKPFKSKRRSA